MALRTNDALVAEQLYLQWTVLWRSEESCADGSAPLTFCFTHEHIGPVRHCP